MTGPTGPISNSPTEHVVSDGGIKRLSSRRGNFRDWVVRIARPLGFFALTLYLFQPTWAILDSSLDYSNFGSYAYFTANGFQYGKDVLSMVGPYGFAFYGFLYAGYLFGTRLLLDLMIKAVLAALIIWVVRHLNTRGWRWVWLAVVVVMAKLTEDVPFDLCVMLIGLYLILRFDKVGRPITLCALAAALAYLSLCKGTQTALVAATFALVSLQALLTRRLVRLGAILGSYAGAYLLLWVLAGQNPLNIPSFLRAIQDLAGGYNAAMSLQEDSLTFQLGASIFALLIAATLLAAALNRKNLPRFIASLFLAGFTFVQWKHGYVRADGHVFIFFHFACISALTALLLTPYTDISPRSAAGRRLLTLPALLAFGVALYASSNEGKALASLRDLLPILPKNTAYFFRLKEEKAKLEAGLDLRRSQLDLPRIRQQIGDSAGVDFFGFSHGVIQLNKFRYTPRPMAGGSFNVYTPYLMRRNESFMLNPAVRPEYFLFKFETVDNRVGSQDDALTLRALISNYEPLLEERGMLLLRARPGAIQQPALQEVTTVDFTFGQQVEVPLVNPDQILLLALDFKPTWAGRLRAFLYKPAHVSMDVEGVEEVLPERRRIVPEMISQPVVFSPFIEDNADFLRLYTTSTEKTLQRFRLISDQPGCYASEIRARFYTMPRPEAPKDVDLRDLIISSRSAIWDLTPESIHPHDAPKRQIGDRVVQFLHAPGELIFRLDGSERSLFFDYGLDPASYPNEKANGVTFLVELEPPGQPKRELFRRHLDPTRVPADQGNQEATLPLPELSPGTRLHLRTDPGPYANTAWDWSYVTRVKFERGPFSLKQFPRFSMAPATVEGAQFGRHEADGRTLFMFHAPGSMEFELNGNERRLVFSCGLLPGAYTNENNTDGVVFIVEYRLPNGNFERLFHRFIRPKTFPAERGDQEFDIPIPFHSPGTRLRIIADPGPSGDLGWDWSYISQLEFR